MTSTFIIAEAGANHNKNFKQALALIDVAVESGASACKFQTYSSNTLYSKNAPDFAGYKNINQLIKDIELPREWQKDLKQYCDERGIEFMSTPFDEKAVDELMTKGFDSKMGARPLQRQINDLVKVPLSKKILFENIATNSTVIVDFTNLAFVFKTVSSTDTTYRIDENGYIVLEEPV